MSYDDLFDVFDLVACCFDCCAQFVFWFIADAGEDVADYWAPYFWVVFAAACFPEDKAFVGVINKDTVPAGARLAI